MAVKRVRMKNKHRAWVKWVVAIGIVAFLGATLAASVGIGNRLLKTAEQYPASVEQESVTVPPEKIIPVRVPAIKAYAYSLGDRYSGYVYADITHLCAPLRDADGALASPYDSGDGIHLTNAAYKKILFYLRTHAW